MSLLRRPQVALLALGLVLLTFAWTMSTQPFAAPDEAAHFLRALNIANGQILGPKVRYSVVPASVSPAELAFVQRDARGVTVPARLSPPGFECANGRPDISGSCLEITYEGNFPPLPYLLPAAALKASGHHLSTAAWLARAASTVQALAFLLLAICLLWTGTAWSVLGLLVALTPMVLFVASVLNPTGVETTACIAFVAAVLRISRAPSEVPRWCWVAFAIAGAVAVVSWPLGIAFAAGALALLGLMLGRDGLRELWRGGGRPLRAAAVTLLGAAAVWAIYSKVSGIGSNGIAIIPLWHGIHLGLEQLGPVLRQAVGQFGALTVALPAGAYWVWWLLLLASVAAALWLGSRRERYLMITVLVVVLAFPVLFYAWVLRFAGFGIQGRDVLPMLIVAPMLSGEIIYRHRDSIAARARPRLLLVAAILLIAVFQGYAWWDNARAAANAPGTIRFYAHASWSPPLGWLPWISLAGLGTLALIGFAGTEAAGSRSAPGRRRASARLGLS